MSDNFYDIFILSVLIVIFILFTYKIYSFNKRIPKEQLQALESNLSLDEIDFNSGFNYFIYEKLTTHDDFEKEKLFLLQYLEKNNVSLKQLSDAHEQIEIYIDFKLTQASESGEKILASFYKKHYSIIKEIINEKFEEKLNHLLAAKLMNSSFYEKSLDNKKPEGIQDKSLGIQLFKLRSK